MRKSIKLLICLSMFLLPASVFAADKYKQGDTVYVSVKSTNLKASESSASKNAATVKYTDALKIEKFTDKKLYVSLVNSPEKKGWIKTSEITKKKITTKGKTSVTNNEITLSAKGMTNVEAEFKANNPSLNFTTVDSIEKIILDRAIVIAFAAQGKLNMGDE